MTNLKSPVEVVEHVQEAFRRYYDTQFWVKSPEIRQERENLLLQHKALYSEPLVELVHPYPASEDCVQVCETLGLSAVTSFILLRVSATSFSYLSDFGLSTNKS